MAKRIIKLLNAIGDIVNNDPDIRGRLRVVYFPDFNVKNAQVIYPAADLSEQISLAGKEASGTGNMKFALNGALTIGTLDGANIEMRQATGYENIFIFGLTADEVQAMRRQKSYRPGNYYEYDPRIKRVVDAFRSNLFCPAEPELFAWIYRLLLNENDEYFHLADLPAYLDAQEQVGNVFQDAATWTRMAILNIARMGKFSSDRAVCEYARDIWRIEPVL